MKAYGSKILRPNKVKCIRLFAENSEVVFCSVIFIFYYNFWNMSKYEIEKIEWPILLGKNYQ